MKLTRQIGLLFAQVEIIKKDNLLSEIQDLDYLRVLEKRLVETSSRLISRGLIAENPAAQLHHDYKSLLNLYLLTEELDSCPKEFEEWIKAGVYEENEIRMKLEKATAIMSELPTKIKELKGLADKLKSTEAWNENFEICSFITAYSSLVDEDFGGEGKVEAKKLYKVRKRIGNGRIEGTLQFFLTKPSHYYHGISSSLSDLIDQIKNINSDFTGFSTLLTHVDSQLENGDLEQVYEMRAKSARFPEVQDYLERKLEILEYLDKEIDKLAETVEKVRYIGDSISLAELFFGRMNFSSHLAQLKDRFNFIQIKSLEQPTGCRRILDSGLQTVNSEISVLEKLEIDLKQKQKFLWVISASVLITIILTVSCYLTFQFYPERQAELAKIQAEQERAETSQKAEEQKQAEEERMRRAEEERMRRWAQKQAEEERRIQTELKEAHEEGMRQAELVIEKRKLRAEEERMRREAQKQAEEERRIQAEQERAEEERKRREAQKQAEEKRKREAELRMLEAEAEKRQEERIVARQVSEAIKMQQNFQTSIGTQMLWVKPGRFYSEELGKKRLVTISKGFYLSKYEVTQKEWIRMGNKPSGFSDLVEEGMGRPVEEVSWNEAVSFCMKLTKLEIQAGRIPLGMAYQLPTEAQWEYACRAGTTTAYSWGNSISAKNASYDRKSPDGTILVGEYPPNPWGFHDMHGNVSEWCADWYSSSIPDQVGLRNRSLRVIRGGSWSDKGEFLRSAKRSGSNPQYRSDKIGFRISLQKI